jgi:hypothetical protein
MPAAALTVSHNTAASSAMINRNPDMSRIRPPWLPSSTTPSRFATDSNRKSNSVRKSVVERPPSPRPSPQGEGESFAASLKYRATGLAGHTSACQKTNDGCSLSPGERVRVRASVETNLQTERDLQVASAGESKRGGSFNSDGEAA